MCHDVIEIRLLTEAAVKAGVVTQLGTQFAARPGDKTAVQLLKDGAIGKIKHAYLCSNRPGAVENYRLMDRVRHRAGTACVSRLGSLDRVLHR